MTGLKGDAKCLPLSTNENACLQSHQPCYSTYIYIKKAITDDYVRILYLYKNILVKFKNTTTVNAAASPLPCIIIIFFFFLNGEGNSMHADPGENVCLRPTAQCIWRIQQHQCRSVLQKPFCEQTASFHP